jgi:hypothetical protein
MKNSNDTIGNPTRDLPACSAVPQPTAPPRGPLAEMSTRNISWEIKAAGAWDWQTYQFLAPIVLKSESLNVPQTSEAVQACTGIALSV